MEMDSLEQGSLFGEDEIEQMETPESKAGKIASEIFKRWYTAYYEGRYTQSVGHIVKVFKKAVLAKIDPYDIEWAANILGEKEQVVTEASLQFALSQVKKYKHANGVTNVAQNDDKEYVESL